MTRAETDLLAADTEAKRRDWWSKYVAAIFGENVVDPELTKATNGGITLETERLPLREAMLNEALWTVRDHGIVRGDRKEVLYLTVIFPNGRAR